VKPSYWFGIIVLYTALTIAFVYLIPSNSLFSFLTYVFGFVFVAVMPGYCLVSLLFKEGKLDLAEKAVLSVALSFALVGVSGLFLGLSSIGMTASPIVISLGSTVVVLAFLAFIRRIRSPQHQAQNSEQPTG
jgi:uncharacterized membrane protein